MIIGMDAQKLAEIDAAIAERRKDAEFMERLRVSQIKNKPLLDRLAGR